MPDFADIASDLSQGYMAEALSAAAATRAAGPSASRCLDCGEVIPETRRLAVPGCVRCVDCQTAVEQEPSWK